VSKPSPCPTIDGLDEAFREARSRMEALTALAKALREHELNRRDVERLCERLGYTPPTEGEP
jgi:hypothetical protein